MKKTILSLVAMLTLGSLMAAPVSPSDALKAASRFWNNHRPSDIKPDPVLSWLPVDDIHSLYVFTAQEGGFVIVAADDCVRPILAYSFNEPFPERPHASLRYWLRGYDEQITAAVETGYTPAATVTAQWDNLLTATPAATPVMLQNIPQMVNVRWDQGDPYNSLCPYDSSGGFRTVVGCVATAMAMIMKYWEYPTFGRGSYSYYDYGLGTISADFGQTTYLWSAMPTFIDRLSSNTAKRSVATISYHCGVATEMSYGSSSGAWVLAYDTVTPCAHNAFVKYFKYSPELQSHSRYNFTDEQWQAMVDTEMVARRPMLYVGYDNDGGHAFILDGSDLQERYHFNWGWSGYGDGFYTLSNLAPGVNYGIGGNATYTFNQHQGALFGIRPGEEETFDTVDYFDTVCNNERHATFHEYELRVQEQDTLLVHLDTVFNYHLSVIPSKRLSFEANGGVGTSQVITYCPADGIIMPECTFTNEGHEFLGWCRKRAGNDTIYQPGSLLKINRSTFMYAIWDTPTVGIEQDHEGTGLELWPNPTCDNLFIRLAQDARYTLLDAVGRRLMGGILRSGESKISLADLPNGVYILTIGTGNGTINRRIIKR